MRSFLSDSAVRVAGTYLAVAACYFLLTEGLASWWDVMPSRWSAACFARWFVFVLITAVLIYLERSRQDRRARYLISIVDSAEAAIVGADAEGTITSWNRGAELLYGYKADEICGRPASVLHPPERRDDLEFILGKVRNGVSIRGYETVRQRKDGSQLPVTLIVSPVRAADGHVVGLSSLAHDISERRRAEKAVQMAEVGQLASGLVHEIRNPLNAMRMQIAVVQDSLQAPSEEDLDLARRQLDGLEAEVLRVEKLANNFLAYGRPGRDKPGRVRVAELLNSVAEFIRPEFKRASVAVRVAIAEEASGLEVAMDRDRLHQILVNVAENARQATAPDGWLSITCELADPGAVRIRLSDTGCGIEPDRLPHIFDAFFSSKEEGTGLGLAIVKKSVETCGGTVRAESDLGIGTAIEITLPVMAPESASETIDETLP